MDSRLDAQIARLAAVGSDRSLDRLEVEIRNAIRRERETAPEARLFAFARAAAVGGAIAIGAAAGAWAAAGQAPRAAVMPMGADLAPSALLKSVR